MDEDLYDEFGNFIGDPTELADSDDASDSYESDNERNENGRIEDDNENRDLVLRDNNGPLDEDVDVLVEIEDREPEKPLVEGSNGRRREEHDNANKRAPKVLFDRDYLMDIFKIQDRQLNIGVFGALHSGKTSFVDMFAMDTHQNLPSLTKKAKEGWEPARYLDNATIEKERGVSLRLNGMSFAYESSRGRTYAVTMLDSPGHVNFWDDVGITMRACQYGVIVIDVIEGINSIVSKLIRELSKNGIPFVIVLNKIDRLVLDLKLPVVDAYHKLQHTVDEINTYTRKRYSPELGNVLFGSTKFGFLFSIDSFVASFYAKGLKQKTDQFVAHLWGQINYRDGGFYQTEFITESIAFIQFILKPIYKVFTQTLSASEDSLRRIIETHFHVRLSDELLAKDPQPLLYGVFHAILPHYTCFIDAIEHLNRERVVGTTSTNADSDTGTTTIQVLRHMDHEGSSWSLCRVIAGSVKRGNKLFIFNEAVESVDASEENEHSKITVEKIALLGGRYVYEIKEAHKGQIVLLKGLEDQYTKYATLSSVIETPLPPIDFLNESVFKLALQPQKPSELPRLLKGLQKANYMYPALVVRVEESGECIIMGTGELYLDCVMEELRHTFSEIEIKVSPPLVQFAESCDTESFASIPVSSNNNIVSISVMAEKLDGKIVRDLTHGEISPAELNDARKFSKRLRTEYGWDSLAARNCWGLSQCNVFIDDTLPEETDKKLLKQLRPYILQGFEWAVKEGPLADERIHACQFKLLEFKLQKDKLDDFIPSQLVPMTRKACYIALMTATPIIMEPIYEVDIIVSGVLETVVEGLIKRRRGGRIYKTEKILASPFIEIKAQLPVIESVGFETDLRVATTGAGMCQMHFCNKIWRKVPGDVLDEEAFIPKLKPAPNASLSRDFVMKTRRRKGLSESGHVVQDGPSLKSYIDNELYEKLKQKGLV